MSHHLRKWAFAAIVIFGVGSLSCRDPETDGIRGDDLVGSWRLSHESTEESGVPLAGRASTRLNLSRDGTFSALSVPSQFIRAPERIAVTFDGSGRWSFEPRTGTRPELVLRFSKTSLGIAPEISWEVRRSGTELVIIESRLGVNGRAIMFIRTS